jgi:hypothetical protein
LRQKIRTQRFLGLSPSGNWQRFPEPGPSKLAPGWLRRKPTLFVKSPTLRDTNAPKGFLPLHPATGFGRKE